MYQTQIPTHNGLNKKPTHNVSNQKPYTQWIKQKALHTMDSTNNEYYVNLI